MPYLKNTNKLDEMKQKGIRLIAEAKVGALKEAVYSPDDLHDIPLGLVEYKAPKERGYFS